MEFYSYVSVADTNLFSGCLQSPPLINHFHLLSDSFGAAPSYRDFHTATVINDRMYIFGGRGDIHSPYHSQDEIYCPKILYLDLKTLTWVMPTTTNKEPIGRRSHSACKSNGFMLPPSYFTLPIASHEIVHSGFQ